MNKKIQADVAVIGAGVSGAAIAHRLSAYQLKTIVLEKEADVSFGTSKANSGIIHAGFHHSPQYLKTRLEIQGNLMFDKLQRELDFPFKRCGIIVAAFSEEEMKTVNHLYEQGVNNSVIGIELCSRDRILHLEPLLNPDVLGGLFAPGGGIIEPYRFVYALMESAIKNGVRLITNFKVTRARWDGNSYTIEGGNGQTIKAAYAVNAAGLYADEVSRIFGGEEFSLIPRKGEYHLLDKLTKSRPHRVLFPTPTKISKGMLVIPTVEGTVLVGPTADEIEDKEDLSTNSDKLEQIFHAARRMVSSISTSDIITSFAGIRPALASDDFFIAPSGQAPHLIQVAGIQSPGLTASPAIGAYVKELLKQTGCILTEKKEYDPYLERVPRIRDLSPFEADRLVQDNPAYGEIVCRCEQVSEAEIIHAIKRGHTTLDGVKFFTRAGAGRCQGGFCSYKTIKIITRETGQDITQISKRGKKSQLIKGRVGDSEIKLFGDQPL